MITKRTITDDQNKQIIWHYIEKRLNKKYKINNKKDNRGIELTYSTIATNCGLTYSQVRNLMTRMVEAGIIEKWSVFRPNYTQRNFYRLVTRN